MGIDLEQPSREHHKEDRLLVNVSVGDPQGEVCNRDGATLSDNAKRDKETTRQSVQSETEVITMGMHDNWQQMGHSNLQAPTLGCSYEMQESIQGMEQLNSRVPVPTLDGYFGTQQIMQGMGQLNAMAPSRDDYYSNQQNIQGLGQLNSIAPIHDAPYLVQQRLHGLGPLHFRPQTIQSCFDIQDSLQHMDQSDVGPTQLHGMASKHLHSKHLSRSFFYLFPAKFSAIDGSRVKLPAPSRYLSLLLLLVFL
ncbi:hypothetical protein TEA_002492 [Camellia sinensis var. sinensis]|uniref:Uncharacterized protein n=1 Tax=Camellia sinensis var. sinensis TaxID=542762 RepID=A0A4S4EUX5_CAMSN|nr:hypothetical protein TEA_002492 [Camellia sinensis var. sinensis]